MERVNFQLVNIFLHGEILTAAGLAGNAGMFFADLVLVTTIGNVKIVGEGFDLPGGEEVFFLNLREFRADAYWQDKQGRSAWPPHNDKTGWSASDLVPTLKQAGLGHVLERNRKVKFYRSAEAALFGLDSRGSLQSAGAVSFVGDASGVGRLLIYATPKFPCSLEITWEESRILSIVSELEEFQLN